MLRERLAPLTSQHPDTVARTPGGPLAAALASQQVTQNQADALDEEPDAANRLAASLSNLAVRLAEPGRRKGALAAIREAAGTYRELAARMPGAHHQELEQSLQVAAWLEHGEDQQRGSPAGA